MAFGPHPPALQVHLCVANGVAAIEFYARAFGATCTMRSLAEDGRRLLHANLSMFGGEVMLRDEFPEIDPSLLAPDPSASAAVLVQVNLAEPKDVDDVIARAEASGARVVLAPGNQSWGSRYGRVSDPFGHHWAFNAPLSEKS